MSPLFVVVRIEEHEQQPDVDYLYVLASVEITYTLQQALYTAGLDAAGGLSMRNPDWIAARRAVQREARGMRAQGCSDAEIAEHFDIDEGSVGQLFDDD